MELRLDPSSPPTFVEEASNPQGKLLSPHEVLSIANQTLVKAFQTYRPPKYEIPMRIQGSLPAWLSGTLFRTSPGLFDISYSVTVDDDQKELHWIRMGHWFDHLPVLLAFRIEATTQTVRYQAHNISRSLEQKISLSHGLPSYFTSWATESNQSAYAFGLEKAISFKKFKDPEKVCCASSIQIEFPALPANNQTASQLSKDRRLLAAFPTWGPPLIQYLDPETLQPVHAVSLFQVQPKLRGYYMSPHWQRDSVGGQWFGCSVEIQLGWLGPYYQLQVLTVPTASEPPSSMEQVKILATLALPHPALIHSFGMTAQFLIIPVYPYRPSTWAALFSLMTGASIMSSFSFDTAAPTTFLIVSKRTGALISTYQCTQSMFGFHVANAYEDGQDVICDIAMYEDSAILDHLRLDQLRQSSLRQAPLPRSQLKRFRFVAAGTVSGDTGVRSVSAERLSSGVAELPTIHPSYRQRPYRFVYAASQSTQAAELGGVMKLWDAIVKVDLQHKTISATWSDLGCFVSEPLFVPRPRGTAEDDGILVVQVVGSGSFTADSPSSATMSSPSNYSGDLSETRSFNSSSASSAHSSPRMRLVFLSGHDLKEIARADLPTYFTPPPLQERHDLPGSQLVAPMARSPVSIPPLSFEHGVFVMNE